MTSEYKKQRKEALPVLAVCYDFDKTLTPVNMQSQGYIQSLGYDVNAFWDKAEKMAKNYQMDLISAYMYMMVNEAKERFALKRAALKEYGSKIALFPGVADWFERIKRYGSEKGIIIEHYILSSGLKEMIEGAPFADDITEVFASSYFYDENGAAIWPAQVVNYTSKTQFLFRIQKGIFDLSDQSVNDPVTSDEIRVPFRNIVYIGDSDTDVPCMDLVNTLGGFSIGVYDAEKRNKTNVYKMMRENRIRYFAPTDYTEGSELDRLMKGIIDRTVCNEALESCYERCRAECEGNK